MDLNRIWKSGEAQPCCWRSASVNDTHIVSHLLSHSSWGSRQLCSLSTTNMSFSYAESWAGVCASLRWRVSPLSVGHGLVCCKSKFRFQLVFIISTWSAFPYVTVSCSWCCANVQGPYHHQRQRQQTSADVFTSILSWLITFLGSLNHHLSDVYFPSFSKNCGQLNPCNKVLILWSS